MRIFSRRNSEAELDAELRAYLELRTDENLRAGMTPETARRAALLKLEGMAQVKEQCRDVRPFHWLTGFGQDVRCAFRNLARHRGFTAVAALSLALGIGANAAIFSVFYSVLLQPLPYKKAGDLYQMGRTYNGSTFVAGPELEAWRAGNHVFEAIGGWNDDSFNLTGIGTPERIQGAWVTPDLLSVLGVSPALGRDFAAADGRLGGPGAVLLTHEFWTRHFASDPTVVGRAVFLNGQPYTITGVLASRFRFPSDLAPDALVCQRSAAQPDWANPRISMMSVIGRPRPGIGAERIAADLQAVSERYAADMPPLLLSLLKYKVNVTPLREELTGNRRPALAALLGAVGLLLLIACVNVANLQLARAAIRQREIGLRAALGASRGRIARWLVVENLSLSGLAGALGIGAAYAILALLRSTPGIPLAGPDDLAAGWTLWCAVAVLSVLAGLLSGLAPALLAVRLALNEALKSGTLSVAGGRGSRLRSVLVAGQVALALVLLVGAGLLLRSLQRVTANAFGFRPDHVLTVRLRLPASRYGSPLQQRQFIDALLDRVSALPGVESAGITSGLPLTGYGNASAVLFEGQPAPPMPKRPIVPLMTVTPDYFRAMGIALLTGRGFDGRDTDQAPLAAVVNEAFVRRFYPGGGAVGKRIQCGGAPEFMAIAGVVQNVRHAGREKEADPQIFVPQAQRPGSNLNLAIHTRNDPSGLAAAVRSAVWSIDKEEPVYSVKTMEARISDAGVLRRVETMLLTAFGLLAMCLAAIGIYGVVSEAVNQRTREIGVRMALGAESGDVVQMVMRSSLALSAVGIAAGVGASFYLTRFLQSLLFGVKAIDAVTFATAGAVLLGVALLAGYLPARRASHIDPAVVLRSE
jgi:putative ABC transport system permease protein